MLSKIVNSFCICISNEVPKNIIKIEDDRNSILPTNPQHDINENNGKENNEPQSLCLATTVKNEGNEKEKFHSIISRNCTEKGIKDNNLPYSDFKLINVSKNEIESNENQNENNNNQNENNNNQNLHLNELKRGQTVSNEKIKKKNSKLKNQSTFTKKVKIIEPHEQHSNPNVNNKKNDNKLNNEEKPNEEKNNDVKLDNSNNDSKIDESKKNTNKSKKNKSNLKDSQVSKNKESKENKTIDNDLKTNKSKDNNENEKESKNDLNNNESKEDKIKVNEQNENKVNNINNNDLKNENITINEPKKKESNSTKSKKIDSNNKENNIDNLKLNESKSINDASSSNLENLNVFKISGRNNVEEKKKFNEIKSKTQNSRRIEREMFNDFQSGLDSLIDKCLLKKRCSESDDTERSNI